MKKHIRVYRVAPLPDIDEGEFEAFVNEQVLPAVDMNPTRGGQLTDTSLLKEAGAERKDRYLWVVQWEGTSAQWVDLRLEEAVKKLDSVGMRVTEIYLTPLG
ncbi:MAG: hypothetical protein ACLFU8_02710 [Anaerolineales bacterium]